MKMRIVRFIIRGGFRGGKKKTAKKRHWQDLYTRIYIEPVYPSVYTCVSISLHLIYLYINQLVIYIFLELAVMSVSWRLHL